MSNDMIYDAITNIDDTYIDRAANSKLKSKKNHWTRYAALAACAIFVIGLYGTINLNDDISSSTGSTTGTTGGTVADVAQVYSTDQPAELQIELVSWQSEGFRGNVLVADEYGLFPVDGTLIVIFEDNTEIRLEDGTLYTYSADDPTAEKIGWETGSIVTVTFTNYEAYLPGNSYYNRLYADSVILDT